MNFETRQDAIKNSLDICKPREYDTEEEERERERGEGGGSGMVIGDIYVMTIHHCAYRKCVTRSGLYIIVNGGMSEFSF